MSNKSGRVFGASLKPAWTEIEINDFLKKTIGDITVYIINHDKDDVEPHTHIYLEYSNPRKISTVANLLGVATNFIEVIRNKKGYLRYLTHYDDIDKHRYDDSEVYTNSVIPYSNQVLGNSMSDKEIAEWLAEGRGIELLGIVPAGKLRTIQSFLHFDNSNIQLQAIRMLNDKIDAISDSFNKIENIAVSFVNGLSLSVSDLVNGMNAIANEISKTRRIASIRKK